MEPAVQPLAISAAPSTPDGHDEDHEHPARGDLVRIALVAGAVAVSWFFPWQPVLHVNIVALTATLVGGYPIFKEARGR